MAILVIQAFGMVFLLSSMLKQCFEACQERRRQKVSVESLNTTNQEDQEPEVDVNVNDNDSLNRYNNQESNAKLYTIVHAAFFSIGSFTQMLLYIMVVNTENETELFLFKNFIKMGIFGFVIPVAFYVRNKSLRTYLIRDLLRL